MSEDLARGILESIADPMVVYDAFWRVRYENDAALKVFQKVDPQGSMLGKVLWEVFPDLAGTAFEREMRRAMETRTPTSFTERRRGSSVWTEVRCYPLFDGGVVAVWKDITVQKRAELTLTYLTRASEVLGESLDYETTIDALARLVVPELADWCSVSLLEHDRIRMVAVAHTDPDKVRLVRELDAKYPSDPGSRTRTAEVIRTGKPELVASITPEMLDAAIPDPEYRAMMRELGFTSAITVPMTVRGATLGAMSLVAMAESGRRFSEADLTLATELGHRAAVAVENARLYREAVAARTSAETANKIKTDFLARMSHELRTPLNAIAGYSDLLLMGVRGPMPEVQRADVERISHNQQHLLTLINEVLDYAKAEPSPHGVALKRVAVREVIAVVESTFAPQLAAGNLALRVAVDPPDLVVLADADRLRQVLFNLVSNAVKFTPAGGRITIAGRECEAKVEIRVTDTGIGIPAEELANIFEPFVQLKHPGHVTEGTGLGLTISRDIMESMGGSLEATSIPGQGSTFIATLQAGLTA